MGSDGTFLSAELLLEISFHLLLLCDFLSMRGVCRFWHHAVDRLSFCGRSFPMLMTPTVPDGAERNFFCLRRRTNLMRLHLTPLGGRKCIEVRFGWLLILELRVAFLFNPYSNTRLDLPDCHDNFRDGGNYTRKGALSVNSGSAPSFHLMVVCLDGTLGIYRSVDDAWSRIESGVEFLEVNYFNGRFYTVSKAEGGVTTVWYCDPFSADFADVHTVVADIPGYCDVYHVAQFYLAKPSNGSLVLVRLRQCFGDISFDIFELDPENRDFRVIRGLGRDALFFGNNPAFMMDSSSAPEGTLRPNTVYFTGELMKELFWLNEERYASTYDLEDGTVQVLDPSLPGPSAYGYEALWIVISSN